MNQNLQDKNSLALSKMNCEINDFNSEILGLVDAESKGNLYTNFVKRFLTYIPVDYRSADKIKLFVDFAAEAFDFFKLKKSTQRKIEILANDFKNNNAITIFIATENRPFIIDSINSLIAKLALQTIFVFHPVINCNRDNEGNLVDVHEKPNNNGIDEVLIYIKVLGSFDDQIIEKYKNEINSIIDLVNYTYNSWQALLNKIILISTNIVQNKDLYEANHLAAEETLDYFNWLQKDNFTFLGAIEFDLTSEQIVHQEGVKEIWQDNIAELLTIIKFSKSDYYSDKLVMLGKINKLSPVHRNALLDYILIKQLDHDGVYRKGTLILGLYGTAIYFQSINNIPILRNKANYVLSESNFPVNGYNAKKIKNIIESLPRDILIQIDEKDLYCMCIHMLSSMNSHKLKLFIQQDWSNSFVNIVVFMPRERLTPDVYNEISHYLTEKFGNHIIFDNITVVAQDFSHYFATISITDAKMLEFSHKDMEQDFIKMTTNWSDGLLHKLSEELGEYEGGLVHKQVESSFLIEYRHKFNANAAFEDINNLEIATKQNSPVFNLIRGVDNEFFLKIYSPEISLTLSDTLPSIENLGFIVIDEQSFLIMESAIFKKSWIYEFKLQSPITIEIPHEHLKRNIEHALEKIFVGDFASDSLSKLITLAGFDWLKVKLLKALTRYLHQTGFSYGKGYVQQVLVKHYQFTKKLINLFESLFCPHNQSQKNAQFLTEQLEIYLEQVDSSTEDKVLNNMLLIVKAIVRTNFYQLDNKNEVKKYLSFKFLSAKVPDLPLPIPYAEIFVYSNDFEGIYLTGGKVARGGLRWSDRGEDYRTEVLGLMKAQMTKNAVIVPVGSKGAFFIKLDQGSQDRNQYMQNVINCYQDFLRGLLDITDNIINGIVIRPKDIIIYDDEAPYLVVAADKGTATFSDYANQISAEYNFWLGDAFASGGSAGYDHKKMGITAKGAWISAQSHFLDMNVDIQLQPFTVIGIGDMSGDVFGNGMLMSQYIKLVAAFNHQHIFIDPTPDCIKSFNERERLFKMPRSSWTDYNKDLISTGGGVYERSAKLLGISPEIKQLLEINKDQVTPDELIKYILKANVDLLWNGGIGTYIKSSNENNIDIGDKANDNVRVNGNEVRAKVIAEGGNVGVSQLGRVEYALKGGALNTDFIDNSAGVDCSDHEVNIKIALNIAVANGKLTLSERNDLLNKMTDQVEKLVLADNYNQNLALTISTLSPFINIESFSKLIKELEKQNLLNSEVEFLPNKAELSRRFIAREGMTRPELAILLSYSKMSLDFNLTQSNLTDDEYYKNDLLEYFPQMMQEKFKEEIENHPLKNEIIRTVVTNKLVNQLSGPVISSILMETGGRTCDLARAYEVVTNIFNLQNLWQKIAKLENSVPMNTKVEMFSDLGKIMRRGISWFVRNLNSPININQTIDEYVKQTKDLTKIISKLLVGDIKTRFFNRIEHYANHGVGLKLSEDIATLEVLVSTFDIIHIAKNTNTSNKDIANLYFECGNLLSIDWLRYSCEAQINDSYWNRLSIQSLKDDFYDKQRRLVSIIVNSNSKNINLKSWLEEHESDAHIYTDFIEEIKTQEIMDLNMIILAKKKLELFLRKLKVNE